MVITNNKDVVDTKVRIEKLEQDYTTNKETQMKLNERIKEINSELNYLSNQEEVPLPIEHEIEEISIEINKLRERLNAITENTKMQLSLMIVLAYKYAKYCTKFARSVINGNANSVLVITMAFKGSRALKELSEILDRSFPQYDDLKFIVSYLINEAENDAQDCCNANKSSVQSEQAAFMRNLGRGRPF